MAEFFKNIFQNTEEERPSGNLFNNLKTEEDSCDSFKNFKEMSDDGKLHLFMFYAPWCGHCKRKTQFLNGLINNYNNHVKVHTYNCERLKGKDKYVENIQGYPTFKMGYKEYKGDTDLLEFVVFAIALTTKLTIKEIIDEMQKGKLNDELKDELEKRRKDISSKFKNMQTSKK
jgi:thiol-disulfide isomerase/thioredoxin